MTELKVFTAIGWENEEFLVIEIQCLYYFYQDHISYELFPANGWVWQEKAGLLLGDTGILSCTTLASVLPDSLAEHFSGLH